MQLQRQKANNSLSNFKIPFKCRERESYHIPDEIRSMFEKGMRDFAATVWICGIDSARGWFPELSAK
jgi:hypothetical protein